MSDGKRRGRPLPKTVRGEDGQPEEWHPMTRRWWNTWRKSPQAMRMLTEPDWDFLLDTAVLHHRFWSGDMSYAPELRLRTQQFGATPADRARLRFEVGSRETPGRESTASADRWLALLDDDE